MTHESTITVAGQDVIIEWEQGDEIDNHGSGCVYYALSGLGTDGKEYIATGCYQDDELEEIEDIEEL